METVTIVLMLMNCVILAVFEIAGYYYLWQVKHRYKLATALTVSQCLSCAILAMLVK